MESNDLTILKITNIDWDKNHQDNKKLPKEINLKWGSKEWNYEQVINWLSSHFGCSLLNLNIQESANAGSG